MTSQGLSLGRALLSRLGENADGAPDEEVLTELLTGLWGAGCLAWPEVRVEPLDWAEHLAHACGTTARADFFVALHGLHAGDFYLACGCALGVPEALSAFDRSYLGQVPVLLSHLRPSPSFVEEVAQVLREKLLVNKEAGPPRIAAYSGHGPLLAWLRVVATRTALNLRRADEHPGDSAAADTLVAAHDPEGDLIARQQRHELIQILREAICSLPVQQRRALRMQLCDGLTGEQLAAQLGVNRSTVVRWLTAARESLLAHSKALFQRRLSLSAGEVESLVAETRSQLDVSLSVLLRTLPAERASS